MIYINLPFFQEYTQIKCILPCRDGNIDVLSLSGWIPLIFTVPVMYYSPTKWCRRHPHAVGYLSKNKKNRVIIPNNPRRKKCAKQCIMFRSPCYLTSCYKGRVSRKFDLRHTLLMTCVTMGFDVQWVLIFSPRWPDRQKKGRVWSFSKPKYSLTEDFSATMIAW